MTLAGWPSRPSPSRLCSTAGATAGPPPSAAEFRCVPLTLRSHPKTSNLFPEFGSMLMVANRAVLTSHAPARGRIGTPPARAEASAHARSRPACSSRHAARQTRASTRRSRRPRLDLLADRHPPIAPAAFRKLDAAAVLTGPSLPVPLLTRPIAPFGLTWSAPRQGRKPHPDRQSPRHFPRHRLQAPGRVAPREPRGHLAPGRSFGSPGPISRSPAPPTRARACGRLTRAARSWP